MVYANVTKSLVYAAVAFAIGWAFAMYMPQYSSSLPAGAIRDLYAKPVQFGLVIAIAVLVVSGVMHSMNKQSAEFSAETYSNLLAPETYGYSGLAPSQGASSNTVQFDNFVQP